MARNIRIAAILATLVTASVLTVPAVAQAWSIHQYRVRDAGPQIIHKMTICDPSSSINRVRVRAEVDVDGGGDRHVDHYSGWQDRRCIRWSFRQRDNLRYEGRYFGRVKVTLLGTVRYTSWRSFWSS